MGMDGAQAGSKAGPEGTAPTHACVLLPLVCAPNRTEAAGSSGGWGALLSPVAGSSGGTPTGAMMRGQVTCSPGGPGAPPGSCGLRAEASGLPSGGVANVAT